MKKLNIGILIISREWGGAQEVAYQLASGLVSQQQKVTIFLNEEIKKYYQDIIGLEIVSLGNIDTSNKITVLLSYIKMRSELKKVLTTCRLDVIHLHLSGAMDVYFRLYNKFKIPTVFTLHGPEIDNYFEKTSILDFLLIKHTMSQAAVVISPSHWQTRDIGDNFRKKIIYIPNGVNTNLFKPNKGKVTEKNILFVGRYVELKGIRELLQVAKLLPKYFFTFVGTGPLASEINLPNTINLGFKSRSELVPIYNQSTICCFPSHHECMSLVGLEAISCGRAVIGTKLGFTEYITSGENGLIINAKNIKELKTAIATLIENKEMRKRFEVNARKKALELDWTKVVTRHLDVYKSVI